MYFVYRHIRRSPNHPFYVGIGVAREDSTTQRRYYDRAYVKQGRTKFWNNISKQGYDVEVMYESEDRDDVIEKEKYFISLYGRKTEGDGSLCNFTSGGEHCELSQKQKDAISKRMIGNKYGLNQIISDEKRSAISIWLRGNTIWRGRTHKEESKIKISEAHKGKKLSPEHIAKLINKTGRPRSIICIESGVEYPTVNECAREISSEYGILKYSAKNSILLSMKRNTPYKNKTYKDVI